MKKKNVLFIMTDQQRSPDFWGDNWAWDNLPAMRRQMEYGMYFRNAFCNTCMCSPSRSTLFTGMYPARHGVHRTLSFGGKYSPTEPQLQDSLQNMARIFFRNGYNVQYRGKWHLSKGNSKGDTKNDLTAAEVGLYGFMGWEAPDAGEDAKPENMGGGFANHDQKYIEQVKDFIEDHKDDEQPWFMVLSLVNPHDVLAYPKEWFYGYQPKDWSPGEAVVPLPGSIDEDLVTNRKPTAQAQLLQTLNSTLGELRNREMQQNYLNFYAGLQFRIDEQINEVLELFFEGDAPNQLFNDTWIIRTSDHGEMGMAHGGLRQKAFNAYEESIRIPLIFSNPEHFPAPVNAMGMVTLVDMMPTLANFLGLEHVNTSEFAGTDFSPILKGEAESVQDSMLFTFDDTRAGAADNRRVVLAADRLRVLRTERWKLAMYFDENASFPKEYEFYDLNYQDPNYGGSLEMANLAYGQPEGYPDALYEEAMQALPDLIKQLEQAVVDKLAVVDQDPAAPVRPTPVEAMLGMHLGQ